MQAPITAAHCFRKNQFEQTEEMLKKALQYGLIDNKFVNVVFLYHLCEHTVNIIKMDNKHRELKKRFLQIIRTALTTNNININLFGELFI